MWLSSHHHMGLDTFLYSLMAHATCHSKYLRVCNRKKKTGSTLFLYLSDLFHSFLQDCTFVRLDIEVVDVIEVGED